MVQTVLRQSSGMVGTLRRAIETQITRWLALTPLTGWFAVACAFIAIAFPTLFRWALNGEVRGCEFTPYVPFILVAAILLRWWQAGLVALASVAIMGGVFEGSLLHPLPCFIPSAGTFIATSAAMIGIATLVSRLTRAFHRTPDQPTGGIVFSLDNGHVWANWYGLGNPVRLGTRTEVSSMMEDFLAQERLAKRLSRDS